MGESESESNSGCATPVDLDKSCISLFVGSNIMMMMVVMMMMLI